MVTNRKPVFVSEQALRRLQELAREQKCFSGDVVDMLLEIKTKEEIENEFNKENKIHLAKRAGRRMDEGANVV